MATPDWEAIESAYRAEVMARWRWDKPNIEANVEFWCDQL